MRNLKQALQKSKDKIYYSLFLNMFTKKTLTSLNIFKRHCSLPQRNFYKTIHRLFFVFFDKFVSVVIYIVEVSIHFTLHVIFDH